MALDDFSRFKRTDLIIVDGKETFGQWKRFPFLTERPSSEFVEVFRVTSANEGRPDIISAQLYGVPQLDWVLIAFNKVLEPLGWPRAGDLIEYPVEAIVLPELL